MRTLSPTTHFTVEGAGRNVSLTAAGIERVERALNRRNLFESHNLALLTAVQDALHAHVLLRATSTTSSRTAASCRLTNSRDAPSRTTLARRVADGDRGRRKVSRRSNKAEFSARSPSKT